MKSLRPTPTTAQRLKRLAPLLATPAALLLSAGRAEAILTYNIFESGSNVVVQTSGSLDLPSPSGTGACGANGAIVSNIAGLCTGPNSSSNRYGISGPPSVDGNVSILSASSLSGISTFISYSSKSFAIDPVYVNNSPIVSSATFNNTTLAGLGFTTTGLIGIWTLDGTPETINVVLGPPATAVPGPLPLFGAAAA